MVNINTIISIIILNANRLNTLCKRQRLLDCKEKKRPTIKAKILRLRIKKQVNIKYDRSSKWMKEEDKSRKH